MNLSTRVVWVELTPAQERLPITILEIYAYSGLDTYKFPYAILKKQKWPILPLSKQ